MPKTKKKAKSSSDSDSDSGPDDRNAPPPKKQLKQPEKSNTKNNEHTWLLDGRLRMVKIREFRGKKMVDIREFYDKDGEVLPGKRGIALTPIQWKKLVEVTEEINAALGE